MSGDPTPQFGFPPAQLGEWRTLSSEQRKLWLTAAFRRFQHANRNARHAIDRGPRRLQRVTIEVDGSVVDGRLGFYCAIGEAVGGPGGYFGQSLQSFDDCLFGGFGLEPPFTVLFFNSASMANALNANSLIEAIQAESVDADQDGLSEEWLQWTKSTLAKAQDGSRTLLKEIIELIRSVDQRASYPPGTVQVVLE